VRYVSLSVVVAPDSFKGTLSATDAATALARGWLSTRPADTVSLLPQADGGEGTLDAIVAGAPGAVRHDCGFVTGPDGTPTPGMWVELADGTAVVELASVSGLPLMNTLDALGASTRGLGEVIVAALSAGANSIIIGLGGSASTDGATGALTALGYRFLDATGIELPAGGGHLTRLHTIDDSLALPMPSGGVTLLTDVTAPLLGPAGAARVFGPQKGASDAEVRELEAGLARLAEVARGDAALVGFPGAGAAGGTAFGLLAVWGAAAQQSSGRSARSGSGAGSRAGSMRLSPGAPWIAAHSGLEEAIASADVLITGEGSFDEQSLLGKTTGNALSRAQAHGVRRVVIAGRVSEAPGFPPPGCEVVSLTAIAGSILAAMNNPGRWVEQAAARAALSI
jgi:glycerate kinase